MKFDTVTDYLEAYQDDPYNHGVLPVPLVAEYLERSPPAVSAMLKAGSLTEIVIGKNRFVQTSSLLEKDDAEAKDVATVRQYLMNMIARGETATFYEPIMTAIGLTTTTPAHRTRIGAILDKISRDSHEERGVVLSVLVHRKTAGTTRPGPGFWGMVESEGLYDPEKQDKDDFVKQHTKLVMQKYRQS
ncbi:hypothetical protein GOL45_30820 [Sinorhizobium medicae]|nr:hypothetical protein [Sinorhizobium medicae]MDX1066540.1 hypothetical protein [Sinorhizobium medicae]MDX2330268.1 hypothetical protein [Sinorhizobium medicae]